MQKTDLKMIKVKETLELMGVDLIGKLNSNLSLSTFLCTWNSVCSDIF